MPVSRKFTQFLKSMVVELVDAEGALLESVEWSRFASSVAESEGFEIRRASAQSRVHSARINLQFNFTPERFELAPALNVLLGLQGLQTRPQVVLALWQYIKLHKLQESDEKKIINNDAALQGLFGVARMSFSDIPVLMEPFLLPPQPLSIQYCLRPDASTNTPTDCGHVYPLVFEVDVDLEPVKGGASAFTPAVTRDLLAHDARLRELLDAISVSQQTAGLFASFAAAPASTATQLLQRMAADYETVVGDVPATLAELQSSEFYCSEAIEQAATEFLALNPRYLQF